MIHLNPNQIINIIESLSRAEDPITGTDISHIATLAQPEVQYALSSVVSALRNQALSETPKKVTLPTNRWKRWTPEEIYQVKRDFLAGKSIATIAKELQRTDNAIKYKLISLDVPIEDYLSNFLN